MAISKRYLSFVKLILIGEDMFLINVLYLCMLYVFGLLQTDDDSYKIFLALINLGYLLSNIMVPIKVSLRDLGLKTIINRNLKRLFLTVFISLFCLFMIKSSVLMLRTFILTYFIVLFVLIVIAHFLTKKNLLIFLSRNKLVDKVVILGKGILGKKLYEEFNSNIYSGIKVIGFFDDDPDKPEILGTIEEVKEFAKENKINKIYCTLPISAKEKILDIMDFSENNLIDFNIVPAVQYYPDAPLVLETEGNIPVLSIRKVPLSFAHNAMIKRIFDIIVSSIFLITIFPIVYIILGIAIKMSSRGPIIFKQVRTGKNGKDFQCYKFRSMCMNGDADKKQASREDPRITRVGRFIRRTNLDELPQFINVLKGDMSIVGPRPHMLLHTSKYSKIIDKYMVRHFIKPGITGLAQVLGYRGETKELIQMEKRIKKDIWYVENWSLLLDIEIIFKTIFITLKGDKKAF